MMKAKVSEQGLLIPREWLAGADEVEIRREEDTIVIVPLKDDPIRRLGRSPVTDSVEDASIRHDHYLYGP